MCWIFLYTCISHFFSTLENYPFSFILYFKELFIFLKSSLSFLYTFWIVALYWMCSWQNVFPFYSFQHCLSDAILFPADIFQLCVPPFITFYLTAFINCVLFRSLVLCQRIQDNSTLSLIADLLHLVLCLGIWSIWSFVQGAKYRYITIILFYYIILFK